jgi:predicted CXXCH cytochrome family protein
MAGYWRRLRLILLLLCLPTLVLASVGGLPVPLQHDRGPLPFDCGVCHQQMARRLEQSAYLHNVSGNPRPEFNCYLCHIDSQRACRFATVRDDEPAYRHNLTINWPAEGRYQLRLRSRNTRADSICPTDGAYVFDTRRVAETPEAVDPPEDDPSRLRISRVSLRRLQEAGGLLQWETNLRADSEAVYWPANAGEHLPLKDERATGMQCCLDCHPPSVWVVSHPVGVRLPASMQNCRLPLGQGGEIICATCHDPHGSRQAYILRQDQDRLCRSCHQGY